MCEKYLKKLTDTISTLNEIEEYFDTLPQKQSDEDSKISDLLHFIESNTISTSGAYSIVRELKRIQIERRATKQMIELNRVLKDNIGKLNLPSNRQILISLLNQTFKKLLSEYKPRMYTQEELKIIAKKVGKE